jgi:cysteine synthase A
LRAALGLAVEVTGAPVAHSGIQFLTAPRARVLRGLRGVDEARSLLGVADALVTAEPGRRVRPAQDAYDRLGYVIATAASSAEVTAALDKAVELITVIVKEADIDVDRIA